MTDKSNKRLLLIDAGNSRIKTIRAENSRLLGNSLLCFSYEETAPAELVSAPFDQLLIASVAGKDQLSHLLNQINTLNATTVSHLHSQTQSGRLRNAYAKPDQLGVDRWLALMGARSICKTSFCVADLGTATTLDAVDAAGQHLGGWIMPGLNLSRATLRQGGHQLRQAPSGAITPFATNTADAITSGTAYAQSAAITQFLQLMEEHSGARPQLFLTGGHANEVLGLLSYEVVLDPLLIFRGMLAQHQT